MTVRPLFALALLSTALLPAAGPPKPRVVPVQAAQTPPPEAKPAEVKAVATPAPSPKKTSASDTELERLIRAKFAKSKISVNGFSVRVESGVAIIEGRTGVIQHKGTATRLAKNAGAKRIDNRVQISDEARKRAAERFGNATPQAKLTLRKPD